MLAKEDGAVVLREGGAGENIGVAMSSKGISGRYVNPARHAVPSGR